MNIDDFIKECLFDNLRKLISEKIDDEIEDKVIKFRNELLDRKDNYIAEVMKGIRILHERDMEGMNYKIIFENVQRIELERK